jgi:MEMO1 family protein
MCFSRYIILFLFLFIYKVEFVAVNKNEKIRRPAVAYSWYPGNKKDLQKLLFESFNRVDTNKFDDDVFALIVPHAGYIVSGMVAASGFAKLRDKYETVIVIGPAHRADFSGASIASFEYYQTPLGMIKVSEKINFLRNKEYFKSYDYAHLKEHSIEMELPFLQAVLSDFEIVPILIGSSSNINVLKSIANSIKEIVDEKTLVIISSDFTHYGKNYSYIPFTSDIKENLRKMDMRAIEAVANKDPEAFFEFCKFTGCTICGRVPIQIFLYMISENDNLEPVLIDYDTSGNIFGDFKNSVSYASIAFLKKESNRNQIVDLSESEKSFLLGLARDSIIEYLKTGKYLDVNMAEIPTVLNEKLGCFVTLKKNRELRGCIGNIIGEKPLYRAVIENAVSSAMNDSRFNKVSIEELDDIDIEISVLSTPKKFEYRDGSDFKNKIRVGIDGVIVKHDDRQSTYLPQVWKQFDSIDNFMNSLSKKGEIEIDLWKKGLIEIYTYESFSFE